MIEKLERKEKSFTNLLLENKYMCLAKNMVVMYRNIKGLRLLKL